MGYFVNERSFLFFFPFPFLHSISSDGDLFTYRIAVKNTLSIVSFYNGFRHPIPNDESACIGPKIK